MHANDMLNQPDEEGRVLVNRNRPPGEPEIYLSPRLAKAVKPHQVTHCSIFCDVTAFCMMS